MDLVLFEDDRYKKLLPLVYFRPVWELRCGITTLADKIKRLFPESKCYLAARDYLQHFYLNQEDIFSFQGPDDLILINGRLLARPEDTGKFKEIKTGSAVVTNHTLVAWRVKGRDIRDYFSEGILQSEKVLSDFPVTETTDLHLIDYPWDLIDRNGENIIRDAEISGLLGKGTGKVAKGAHILGADNIYLGANSRLLPGVVLDAESGPIWIDEYSQIMPNAVIQGPVALGTGCRVKIGAKIYHNTSAGPVCKLGGEIEETIFQDYTNKQHDGFLGHSYLGSWINIGADTNNSDLKNNYGEISVYLLNETIPTGKRFLGLIMGDHSKTAINTMFNTGTVVGVNCNIFGEGFPPKFIPSFSWAASSGMRDYDFSKAVEVARVVMERRKIQFEDRHIKLFQAVKNLAYQIENRVRIQA